MQCSVLRTFFVLFKQKTAYEMRISDWSSDVCSSDLPAPRMACPLAPTFAGHACRFVKEQGYCVVRFGTVKVPVTRPLVPPGTTLPSGPRAAPRPWTVARPAFRSIQNGRASCRDRECQYV